MKAKIFTTRADAEAIRATIRVFSPEHLEVWLHTASNRQCIGTFDNEHDANSAVTSALIGACYDFDGPFDPEAWSDVIEALYAVEHPERSLKHRDSIAELTE